MWEEILSFELRSAITTLCFYLAAAEFSLFIPQVLQLIKSFCAAFFFAIISSLNFPFAANREQKDETKPSMKQHSALVIWCVFLSHSMRWNTSCFRLTILIRFNESFNQFIYVQATNCCTWRLSEVEHFLTQWNCALTLTAASKKPSVDR